MEDGMCGLMNESSRVILFINYNDILEEIRYADSIVLSEKTKNDIVDLIENKKLILFNDDLAKYIGNNKKFILDYKEFLDNKENIKKLGKGDFLVKISPLGPFNICRLEEFDIFLNFKKNNILMGEKSSLKPDNILTSNVGIILDNLNTFKREIIRMLEGESNRDEVREKVVKYFTEILYAEKIKGIYFENKIIYGSFDDLNFLEYDNNYIKYTEIDNNLLKVLISMETHQELNRIAVELIIKESIMETFEKNKNTVFEISYLLSEMIREKDLLVNIKEYFEENQKINLMGRLACGIAHDLNNILTSIMGNSEILERSLQESEFKKLAGILKKSSLDGSLIVRRLLSYIGNAAASFEVINLSEVLDTAIEIAKPICYCKAIINNKNINILKDIKKGVYIYGLENEIRGAIINMIINSVDAIESHGSVKLKLNAENGEAVIKIIDNGKGMNHETKAKIFDSFFSTKGKKGYGLGLSNVISNIEKMDGKVTVDSRVRIGTRMVISFPLSKVIEIRRQESSNLKGLGNISILVIDDREEICNVVKDMTSFLGEFNIETETNGKRALKKIKNNTYNIIITDLAMPDLNGYDIINYIRDNKIDVFLVVMTGWMDKMDDEFRNKIDFILFKPFTMEDLNGMFEAYCKNFKIEIV